MKKYSNISRNRLIRTAIAAVLSFFIFLNAAACVDNSNKNPVITISVESDESNKDENGNVINGSFQIELYPDKAPNSAAYFIDLAANGTYNGFSVSMVWSGHKVQFGDPWYSKHIDTEIEGEFKENGYEGNDVVFERGTVALARYNDDDYNSAVGDFFIILSDDAAEDHQGKYAAIGKVISGIELLDKISNIKCYPNLEPIFKIRTGTVSLDLKGKAYDKPVTNERRKENMPGTWT